MVIHGGWNALYCNWRGGNAPFAVCSALFMPFCMETSRKHGTTIPLYGFYFPMLPWYYSDWYPPAFHAHAFMLAAHLLEHWRLSCYYSSFGASAEIAAEEGTKGSKMFSNSSQFTPYTLSSANFIWISPLYNLHSANPFVNMSALTSETPSHFVIRLCNLHSAIPFVNMSAQDISNVYWTTIISNEDVPK